MVEDTVVGGASAKRGIAPAYSRCVVGGLAQLQDLEVVEDFADV